MSRPKAVLLGIATVIPPVYFLVFLVAFFSLMMLTFRELGNPALSGEPASNPVLAWIPALFVAHFIVMLLMFALIAIYLVFLFGTSAVQQEYKVLWAVVLLLFGIFAMPVFWYLHVWRQPRPAGVPLTPDP